MTSPYDLINELRKKYNNNITIVISGLRGTGKSTLIRDFLEKNRHTYCFQFPHTIYNDYPPYLYREYVKNIRYFELSDRYFPVDHLLFEDTLDESKIVEELIYLKDICLANRKLFFILKLNKPYVVRNNDYNDSNLTKDKFLSLAKILDAMNIEYKIFE